MPELLGGSESARFRLRTLETIGGVRGADVRTASHARESKGLVPSAQKVLWRKGGRAPHRLARTALSVQFRIQRRERGRSDECRRPRVAPCCVTAVQRRSRRDWCPFQLATL